MRLDFPTIASSLFSILPRTEASEEFITAQQVREIRAQLRRMSEQKVPRASVDTKDGAHHRQERIDTEHRGVAGTLVLSDELDEKVLNNPLLFY